MSDDAIDSFVAFEPPAKEDSPPSKPQIKVRDQQQLQQQDLTNIEEEEQHGLSNDDEVPQMPEDSEAYSDVFE